MPPRDPQPANRRRKSKPKLDVQEPALTKMLEQYCDLRRRGFGQQAIQTKASWPRHYPKLLLEEAHKAQNAGLPGKPGTGRDRMAAGNVRRRYRTQGHPKDVGLYWPANSRRSCKPPSTTRAAQPRTASSSRILTESQPGYPGWHLNGELMHRPFDGAFPAHYPEERAIRQCTEVLYRLISYPNNSARDRAYTMLSMAQAGLHSFDYDSGRWVHAELERSRLDEDAKHTVIMKLHPHPSVGKLLLQRCGMSSRWLTGNRARLMSRRLRDYQFSPAFIRNLLEHIGVDPNTYYIIGPDYRIPEPSEEEKAQCIQALQQIGFTTQNIQSALSTLGVPPGGHHPPKRSSKKQA